MSPQLITEEKERRREEKAIYAKLLSGTDVGRPPEREREPEPIRIDMRSQKQKALEQQRWARKHPREYKKLVSLHGKPVAQKEYLASLRAKEQAVFERKQAVAKVEWRQQLRQQYPVEQYLILWRDEKAEIYGGYPKPSPVTTRYPGGLKVGRLERGALEFWKAIPGEEPRTVVRSPFKPISKRYGGLAETDIPRDVEELASGLFSWREEHVTPREFEQKYGPFTAPLGLPIGTRITHVRRTGRGYEMQFLEPLAYDVTKPWGVTREDVEALKKQGKLFTAYRAETFMAGGIWQRVELTPKQFQKKHGISFELPKGSLITSWRYGAKGYEIRYMPKEEWEALPSYVKEEREPTFWEVPLYTHLVKGWGGIVREGEKRREQLFGKEYVAMEKLGPTGFWRESEKRIGYASIGLVKFGESTVGFVEALAGHPSLRSYIPTAGGALVSTGLSFFPETQIGPLTIGKGGWGATGEYLEAEMESVKEHPEMIAGELAGDILLGYVTGKGLEKAWGGVKWAGAKAGPTVKKAVVWTGEKTWQYSKPLVKQTLGLERYFYYSTGISRVIWSQRIASAMALFGRTVEMVPKTIIPKPYSLFKSVYLPNIARLHKVIGPTVSHYAGYVPKPSLPSLPVKLGKAVRQTRPYMLARDVYLPNIGQLGKVVAVQFAPTKGLASSMIEIGFPAMPHISKPEAYMLLKSVYAPNIKPYLRGLMPKVPRLSVSFKRAGISMLGEERYYYYRYVAVPLTKANYAKMVAGLKGVMPEIKIPSYKPMWLLERKALAKVIVGKARYKLHVPLPKGYRPYKPMAPFSALVTQETATKTVSTLITREIVKPKPIAKIISPTIAPIGVAVVKSVVKKKREKHAELPSLVEWKGLEFPSMYAMSKSFQQLADEFTLKHQLPPVKVKELKAWHTKSYYRLVPSTKFAETVEEQWTQAYAERIFKIGLGIKGDKEKVTSTLYHELGHHLQKIEQARGQAPIYEQTLVKRSSSAKEFMKEWMAWQQVPSELHTEKTSEDRIKALLSYYSWVMPRMRKKLKTPPKTRPWLPQKRMRGQQQRQRQLQRLMQPQRLRFEQVSRQITRQVQIQVPIQTQIFKQAQLLKQAQGLRQAQIQKQLQRQKGVFGPSRLGLEGFGRSRGARGMLGVWFKKTHPIKTHREMRETFFGKPRRRKKAKKKKRGRKRKR